MAGARAEEPTPELGEGSVEQRPPRADASARREARARRRIDLRGPDPSSPARVRLRIARRRLATGYVRRFGPATLACLARTWRCDVLGAQHLERAQAGPGGCLIALWHGRMIVGLPHHARRDWHVLVSPSDDGEISKLLLDANGYTVIRGSTSRGAPRAMREMLAALERGKTVAITPDGPRGPRHSMNPGLAWMSGVAGYPIVPCGIVCNRAWRARSWDRLTVPKPGARIAFVYEPPLVVGADAGEKEIARATEALRESLMSAERRGFERLGVGPDW